jgi:hypothetical protein
MSITVWRLLWDNEENNIGFALFAVCPLSSHPSLAPMLTSPRHHQDRSPHCDWLDSLAGALAAAGGLGVISMIPKEAQTMNNKHIITSAGM